MYCKKCGNELNRIEKFCGICGEKVEIDLNSSINQMNVFN